MVCARSASPNGMRGRARPVLHIGEPDAQDVSRRIGVGPATIRASTRPTDVHGYSGAVGRIAPPLAPASHVKT